MLFGNVISCQYQGVSFKSLCPPIYYLTYTPPPVTGSGSGSGSSDGHQEVVLPFLKKGEDPSDPEDLLLIDMLEQTKM